MTTQGGPNPSPSSRRTKPWVEWLVVAVLILAVGGIAYWYAMGREAPEPIVTPSPTPTISEEPAAFADVNGRWCDPVEGESSMGCVTVELPAATWDNFPDEPDYVFTDDLDSSADPATIDYDFAPNYAECWSGVVMPAGGDSGAAFVYCPVGALPDDEDLAVADASVERLWVTQDTTALPFVREE
ncbi:hypothetical protein [Demequina sp.]|uniref:hypothetical protein n=1 Tax=Demequina sp. TaxID=2050685 RepID=UPI003D0C41B4